MVPMYHWCVLRWFVRTQAAVKRVKPMDTSNSGIHRCLKPDFNGLHLSLTNVSNVLYTKEQLARPLIVGMMFNRL